MRRQLLVGLFIAGVVPSAWAQEEAVDDDTLIHQVLSLSGVAAQLDQMPAMVDAQLAQRQGELDAEGYATLRQVAVAAYSRDALSGAAREAFRRAFDREKFLAVREWAQSPPVRRITVMEVESLSPQGQQQMAAFLTQLPTSPPSPQRFALVERFSSVTAAPDHLADVTIAMMQGMAGVVDPMLPPDKRLKPGELEAVAEEMRDAYADQFAQSIVMNFLFTYRSLTDEELAQYIAFWDSELGQWFNGLYTGAMVEAAAQCGRQAAAQLAPLLSAPPR